MVSKAHLLQKGTVSFIKRHRTIKILHLFRSYSALIVVISSAFLVSATNLAAGRGSSGFLFGYFEASENYENPLKDKIYLGVNKKTNTALTPLLEADTLPDPSLKPQNEDDLMIMQGQAVVAGTSPVRMDPKEDGGVIIYEVAEGDTVSAIAAQNNVSVNTILWSNEIDNVDSIKPGDKLFILPVSGISYTVKKGDSLSKIADKYKSDQNKIIAFNNLPADGELTEGEEIIIPDGQKEIPRAQTPLGIAARPYAPFESTGKILEGKAGTGHKFPYGYCTWYVASRRYIPWGGNAGTWLYHAKAAGYATGRTPRVGSIMVSSESWWGHVAIVEKVSGGTFTISEMNYAGWAKRSTRTISTSSRAVKGFIY